MSDEKKRIRRSAEEVKAEKKAKYLEQIEAHKEAIKALEQKIKELDKPKKTQKQIKAELLKALEKKSVEELAALAGISIEEE